MNECSNITNMKNQCGHLCEIISPEKKIPILSAVWDINQKGFANIFTRSNGSYLDSVIKLCEFNSTTYGGLQVHLANSSLRSVH